RHETLEQFAETFGPCGFRKDAFSPAYGLAEATLIVSGNARGRRPVTCSLEAASLGRSSVVKAPEGSPGSRTLIGCGEAVPEQNIVIADPESLEPCLPEQVGEIWVSGPSVARGYWKRPKETEQTFRARLAGTGDGSPLGARQNGEGPF